MLKEDKCVNNKNCLENKHIIPYLSIILRSEYVYISRHLNTKYNFWKNTTICSKKIISNKQTIKSGILFKTLSNK